MSKTNKKRKTELNLYLMMKTFLSRFKWLIIALLVGAIVGGTIGFLTNFKRKIYGTDVQFQIYKYSTVSAESKKISDKLLISFLNSNSFWEILYCDEFGVPIKQDSMSDELKKEIDNAKIQAEALHKERKLNDSLLLQLKTEKELTATKKACYEIEAETFDLLTEAYRVAVESGKVTTKQEEEYFLQKEKCLLAYDSYTLQLAKELEINDKLVDSNEKIVSLEIASNDATIKTISLWRKSSEYTALLSKISKAEIKFTAPEEISEHSFFTISVSVDGDEETAKELFQLMQTKLPRYINTTLINNEFLCAPLSSEVIQLNAREWISQTIKKAILFALLSVLVNCIVIAIIDREKYLVRVDEKNED